MNTFEWIIGCEVAAGMLLGLSSNRQITTLLLISTVVPYALWLAMMDWSEFDFARIVHTSRSWQSWAIWLLVYFLWSTIPTWIGTICGACLRRVVIIIVAKSKHARKS